MKDFSRMSINRYKIIWYLLILVGVSIASICLIQSKLVNNSPALVDVISAKDDSTPENTRNNPSKPVNRKNALIPEYVIQVFEYIQENQRAPSGYVGGRNFQNREGLLRKTDDTGSVIRYREWDVHPKKKSVNRGAERLVTGSDHSAYYTKDHYKSFIKFSP